MTSCCFEVEEEENEKCLFFIINDIEQGKVDEVENEEDNLSVCIYRNIELNWKRHCELI